MKKLLPVMLAGTGSDVGKSVIAAGLCRVFLQDGYNPAPFKAQNMALNSYSTPDGLEIGRAQAVQAEAAGLKCSADMNPLLLKPVEDCMAQVVLNGKSIGNYSAKDYFLGKDRSMLREEVRKAFHRLSAEYNPIVLEGAGSISELNLKSRDLVNMPMAADAGAKVILVADIDRGGVFASAYGSIMLQDEADRKRIVGIIINKFRGDIALFSEGRRIMEEICGVPVLGVVPYFKDINIEEEDSLSLARKRRGSVDGKINIAVVLIPHLSNFTDFDSLEHHPAVNLYYASSPEELTGAKIVILPGSKSTVADLEYLNSTGFSAAIRKAHEEGKSVAGICGGYQMLGEWVDDEDCVESSRKGVEGIGLLPVRTRLGKDKKVRQTRFRIVGDERICEGYEIHQGVTYNIREADSLTIDSEGCADGCRVSDKLFGSYIHGIFDNPAAIGMLLSPWGEKERIEFDYREFKDSQYNRLADLLRQHIDIPLLYSILEG